MGQYTELTFQLIVESSPNAIILVNKEGKIAYINRQSEDLFKYSRAELIGTLVEILIPERFRAKHPEFRNSFFESPAVRFMGVGRELFALRKDGTEFPIEIGLNPIVTVDGTLVLASIIDITERKIQEITQKKQVELEIRNKELEQFAYIASHDLQEPLRTVSNYIQIFEEDYAEVLDANAHKYLSSINNASKRMSLLVKALLDFSRLGGGKEVVTVDFAHLIQDVIDDLETIIKGSDAEITISEMPKLPVYETEIRQLFQNLLLNAIKFRKKENPVQIEIKAEKVSDKWKFSVSDNGIGIDPIHFERIFYIFQHLHSTEEYEGNGIGLANCKKIVELHQGEIWVESSLGKGAKFYFTL